MFPCAAAVGHNVDAQRTAHHGAERGRKLIVIVSGDPVAHKDVGHADGCGILTDANQIHWLNPDPLFIERNGNRVTLFLPDTTIYQAKKGFSQIDDMLIQEHKFLGIEVPCNEEDGRVRRTKRQPPLPIDHDDTFCRSKVKGAIHAGPVAHQHG